MWSWQEGLANNQRNVTTYARAFPSQFNFAVAKGQDGIMLKSLVDMSALGLLNMLTLPAELDKNKVID